MQCKCLGPPFVSLKPQPPQIRGPHHGPSDPPLLPTKVQSPYAVPTSALPSLSLLPSNRLTPFSTSFTRPSQSTQHSPLPTTPTTYHHSKTFALLALNASISLSCRSCAASSLSSRGFNAKSFADEEAGGIAVSRRVERRDAVVGNWGARERRVEALMERSGWSAVAVVRVEGGLKRFGCLDSVQVEMLQLDWWKRF